MIVIPKMKFVGCRWMLWGGVAGVLAGIPLMYLTEQAYMWAFSIGCALLLAGAIGMDQMLRCPKCGEKLLRLDMGTGMKSLFKIVDKPETCPSCGKKIQIRLK